MRPSSPTRRLRAWVAGNRSAAGSWKATPTLPESVTGPPPHHLKHSRVCERSGELRPLPRSDPYRVWGVSAKGEGHPGRADRADLRREKRLDCATRTSDLHRADVTELRPQAAGAARRASSRLCGHIRCTQITSDLCLTPDPDTELHRHSGRGKPVRVAGLRSVIKRGQTYHTACAPESNSTGRRAAPRSWRTGPRSPPACPVRSTRDRRNRRIRTGSLGPMVTEIKPLRRATRRPSREAVSLQSAWRTLPA